jgi:hypothetical protein
MRVGMTITPDDHFKPLSRAGTARSSFKFAEALFFQFAQQLHRY